MIDGDFEKLGWLINVFYVFLYFDYEVFGIELDILVEVVW